MLPKIKTPRLIILALDVIISIISLIISFFIRLDLNFNILKQEIIYNYLNAFISYILIKTFILFTFKIHKNLIRFTSYVDILKLFYASTTCTIVYCILSFIRFKWFESQYLIPPSIIIIEFFV